MLLCVVFSSTIAFGQKEITLKPVGMDLGFWSPVTVLANESEVGYVEVFTYAVLGNFTDLNGGYHLIPTWKPDDGVIIAKNTVNLFGDKVLKVLVKNVSGDIIVHVLDFSMANDHTGPVDTKYPPLKAGGAYGESWVKIDGDATYILSTYFVYVYRDSVLSWQVDTTGLGSASITDISLDTAQYVYAATSKGVFKQNPDSSVWHQITNLPANNFSHIFADRFNRIFAANYVSNQGKGTYVSTDNGSSWTLDSAGIGGFQIGIGGYQILQLSDDAYGNTYAIANHGINQVYRRKNNTPGWTRIDGGITAITVNPPTINSVGGDSILHASTSFGLYASTDQGTTWTEDNADNPALHFYAFAKGAGGKWFTSTDLALYSLGSADTAWTKVFPTSGFQGSLQIFTDGLGNIYSLGAGNNNVLPPPYMSTNGGISWNIDTAGMSVIPGAVVFFVDEKGGQHASSDDYLSSSYLYTKPYGGSWGLDTAGFRLTSHIYPYSYSSTAAIASDRHGYLYASGTYLKGSTQVNGQVIRRPINGGIWVADTVGLSSYSNLSALVPGKNGDMYGTYLSHLVHRSNGGTWSNINVPVIAGSKNNSMALSVDSSGALFAAIKGDDANFTFRGLGIYFTADTGKTWKYAGLDSIAVNQLVSYGDTTYAATNNGLYILTRKAVVRTGVEQVRGVPMSYALYQNYPNPFNPTTNFRFTIGSGQFVSLKIYDVLGREVTTLVNEKLNPGSYNIPWNGGNSSSGVYFYQLQAGSFVETKKMVLMK